MPRFCAHVIVGMTIYVSVGLMVPDARLYDESAQQLADFWSGTTANQPTFAVGKEGWVLILASLYRLFGHEPALGLIVNALAGVLTTSLVMGITARGGRQDRAVVAGWLSFLPQFISPL